MRAVYAHREKEAGESRSGRGCNNLMKYYGVVLELIFNSLVTLLVVIDPLGLAPLFAALTRGYPEKRKREAALRGTALGAVILFLFALAGDALLGALGIGIAASGSPAASCFFFWRWI
jgi:small neutral amino acid transporter SnatA (MarC family)